MHTYGSVIAAAHSSDVPLQVANLEAVLQQAPQQWPLLVDPQTAGGLLAGVPAQQAEACVKALRAAGYAEAAVVGSVSELPGEGVGMMTVEL
jgi:selenide,water dikinase